VLQYVAVCCSDDTHTPAKIQETRYRCEHVCCCELQCAAVSCSMLQWLHTHTSEDSREEIQMCICALQCVAVCCSVLQYVAVCRSVLQFAAVCCSVLQWSHTHTSEDSRDEIQMRMSLTTTSCFSSSRFNFFFLESDPRQLL